MSKHISFSLSSVLRFISVFSVGDCIDEFCAGTDRVRSARFSVWAIGLLGECLILGCVVKCLMLDCVVKHLIESCRLHVLLQVSTVGIHDACAKDGA